jgi:hypothetical protein
MTIDDDALVGRSVSTTTETHELEPPVDSITSIGPNEINHLHDEIMDHARISLAKAIQIGEALQAWKERLGHGNWMPWFKANIRFSLKTADRYRLLYARRDELKFDNVTNLADAFRFLSGEHQNLGDLTKWPKISIKHLGVFVKAFGSEDEDGYCRLDLGPLDLLGIPVKEGRQAVEVYFDESHPEDAATFWFYCISTDTAVNKGMTWHC